LAIMASGVLTYDAFTCKKCGICCKKQKVVLLTLYDIFRLSEKLGLRPNEFFRRYCIKSRKFNEEGLKRLYLRAEGGCPFLRDGLCSVHDVKPVVCARAPFYYVEASLASLKVFGILEDECCINEYSYDTIAKGDNERLVDMDILVRCTDEYVERHGGFDEKTARPYYEKSLEALKDAAVRGLAYATLLDQCIRREEMCRTDPYYKGATNMYLSGFYDEFKRTVNEAGKNGEALTFEPSALGVIDGIMALVLFEKDYISVKKALSQSRDLDVHTRTNIYEGREYAIISIDAGKKVMFYYHIEPDEKKSLRHEPGHINILFKNEKGGRLMFTGRDADGWLS